jgi:hypothetical protein
MFLGLLLLASIGLVWTEFVYGAKWRESRRLRRERECESGRETIEVAEGEEGDRRSGKG